MSHIPQNGNAKANGSGQKEPTSRQSPPPLAPLQYLQNQRRGSITDPSLHAASNMKLNKGYRPPTEQPGSASSGSSSAQQEYNSKLPTVDPRPSSPYIFGDATPHVAGDSLQIRNLLRSPSLEKTSTAPQDGVQGPQDSSLHDSGPKGPSDTAMEVDSRPAVQPFDYSMRRHSIAVGQDKSAHLSHGTKRKMSMDRSVFAPVGEEIDPQLAGPGIPSSVEGPAPKRRGSAIDTQRIAQLSLNERRNSVDSRGTAQWWLNDRRNSTSSIFSNVSSLGYSSGFTGADSPQSRVPSGIATFAWPANSPADQSGPPPMHTDPDPNAPPHRPFDPTQQIPVVPSMNFAPDRRMSVPDAPPSATTTRALRSRSRPPSRPTSTPNAEPNLQAGPSSSTQDDNASAPSPSSSGRHKESSSTPYSRSPELRVSHKLAERKRRKEMKDLFDELRDQLPADRGMKASKWEILSKAIDFVQQLKHSHQEMAREIEMLRHEVEAARQGMPFAPGGPPSHVVYGQPPGPGQFPPPPGAMPHPHVPPPAPPHSAAPPQAPLSRPPSSQNVVPPGAGQHSGPPPPQNGNAARTEPPP
ncbi:putative helix loop helix domain containing protein [Lyophyllum shimeji]|uniref:Helix loop helix domain containing protein n=1 Tax=Lyophyllum shimeji TaxID=47721 RepID=A0A9P3PE72_LYOSH|nr:putative helix loop helix domain containing protein [Lyophyllum shimeji]